MSESTSGAIAIPEIEIGLLPCPHCGSSNLSTNEWSLESGDVPAIECDDCFSGAVLSVWNERTVAQKEHHELRQLYEYEANNRRIYLRAKNAKGIKLELYQDLYVFNPTGETLEVKE